MQSRVPIGNKRQFTVREQTSIHRSGQNVNSLTGPIGDMNIKT